MSQNDSNSRGKHQPLCEAYVSVPMPESLAARLRSVADRDYSSVAATARRLLAVGVARELANEALAVEETR